MANTEETSMDTTVSASVNVKSDSEPTSKIEISDKDAAQSGDKPKPAEEKVEGAKADGESESLEVLVDDTQNDLDADLQKGGDSESSETRPAGDTDEAKAVEAPEATDAAKPESNSETKTADGESKPEEKKTDDAKRLVGFV